MMVCFFNINLKVVQNFTERQDQVFTLSYLQLQAVMLLTQLTFRLYGGVDSEQLSQSGCTVYIRTLDYLLIH